MRIDISVAFCVWFSSGYCWCAHEETGKPIPGTSVQNSKPNNCDNIPAHVLNRPTPPPPPKESVKPVYQPLSAEEGNISTNKYHHLPVAIVHSKIVHLFINIFFFKTQPAPAKESPASNRTWLNSSKRTWLLSWSIKQPTIQTGIKSILLHLAPCVCLCVCSIYHSIDLSSICLCLFCMCAVSRDRITICRHGNE